METCVNKFRQCVYRFNYPTEERTPMFIYFTLSGLTLKINFYIYMNSSISIRKKKSSTLVSTPQLKSPFPFSISYFAQQVLFFYSRRLSLTQTFIKHLQFCHFRILSSLHFTIKFPSLCHKIHLHESVIH